MNTCQFINRIMIGARLVLPMALAYAGTPVWAFEPLTTNAIGVASNAPAIHAYQPTKSNNLIVDTRPEKTPEYRSDVANSSGITQVSTVSADALISVTGSPLILFPAYPTLSGSSRQEFNYHQSLPEHDRN